VITRVVPLACMVLVLMLFGHDGLMATVAHAAPLSSLVTASHEHPPSHTPTVASGDEQPTHPFACGIGGEAVSSPSSPPDFDLLVVVAIAAMDVCALAQPTAHKWDEPVWPPGTFRAWIQVYRI
jgi:hypothetical protein